MFCTDKSRQEVQAIHRERKLARDRDRQRRKRQPMIQEASADNKNYTLGRRELAILRRLNGDWTPATALIEIMTSDATFATVAPASMRPLVHRSIKRLQRCGKADVWDQNGEGEKQRMLVRAKKPS